jgi:hypothetical protein
LVWCGGAHLQHQQPADATAVALDQGLVAVLGMALQGMEPLAPEQLPVALLEEGL